jgi:hypothetical protein
MSQLNKYLVTRLEVPRGDNPDKAVPALGRVVEVLRAVSQGEQWELEVLVEL